MTLTSIIIELRRTMGRVVVVPPLEGAPRAEHPLREAHRFVVPRAELPDGPHWEVMALWREVLLGLQAAGRLGLEGPLAVSALAAGADFALLDRVGVLLGLPYHYAGQPPAEETPGLRDYRARTGSRLRASDPVPTLLRMQAERSKAVPHARFLLPLPDLLHTWLSAAPGVAWTSAAQAGLVNHARGWAGAELAALGLPEKLLPPLLPAGAEQGRLQPAIAEQLGLPGETRIIAGATMALPAAAALLLPGECAVFACPLDQERLRLALPVERPPDQLPEGAWLAGAADGGRLLIVDTTRLDLPKALDGLPDRPARLAWFGTDAPAGCRSMPADAALLGAAWRQQGGEERTGDEHAA